MWEGGKTVNVHGMRPMGQDLQTAAGRVANRVRYVALSKCSPLLKDMTLVQI